MPTSNQSLWRLVSLGTVALDKADGSKYISVFLKEKLPFHEGDITPDHVTIERKGTDADGNTYTVNLQRGMTVKAVWKGDGNRVTAPNVRKGEQVYIYTVGSTDVYYWEESGRDSHLRRGEAITWAYNASEAGTDVDEPPTAANSYTHTIDTKNGHITTTTSMANGEKASYTVQFNGRLGHYTVKDHLGNIIQIDSDDGLITLQNQAGSFVTLNQKVATIYADDTVMMGNKAGTLVHLHEGVLTAKAPDHITMNAPKIILDGVVEVTKDFSVIGNTTFTGSVSGQTGNFTSGTASDPGQ